MIKQVGSFKFPESIKKFKDEKNKLPRVLGVISLRHFLLGFRKDGGQTDEGKWKARAFSTDKTRRNLRRGTLVKTGALRRSLKVTTATFRIIKLASKGLKYAAIHNFGGTVRVTAKSRRFFWAMFKRTGLVEWKNLALTKKSSFDIPKREYVGDSKKLIKVLEKRIIKETDKVFKL